MPSATTTLIQQGQLPTRTKSERTRTAATTSTQPIASSAFGYNEARHLLWRAGFGGTPEQIRALVAWGPSKAVDTLLDFGANSARERRAQAASDTAQFDRDIMSPVPLSELEAYRRARREGDEETLARLRRQRQNRQRADRGQIRDMQQWWLTKMIETAHPLEEKLTLFWHGHFATGYRTIENSAHMLQQNEMFREHAAGNFGKLLYGIIRDPAMLGYLNNDRNVQGSPNENLARELMELFSLGEGNYSENDIKEGARALTGYTFNHNDFVFEENEHDSGSKRILGKRGPMDGEDFVAAILGRKACAQYIAFKLYNFFVMDVPADPSHPAYKNAMTVVNRLASTLRQSRYDVKPMLRQLFRSRHFYDTTVMRDKIKSPAELVVGAVRSLGPPVRDLGLLVDAMNMMGQEVFFPPNVAGWSGGRTWINTSTLYVRQNIMTYLMTGQLPAGFDPAAEGDRYEPMDLIADIAASDPDWQHDARYSIDNLIRFVVGGEPTERQKQAMREYFAHHNNNVNTRTMTGAITLMTVMPEYQLC